MELKYRDKLSPSDLLDKPKDEIKLLTICNYGQVRSICMAMHLSALGFSNVYATGFMRWHPSVINRQMEDADLVIVCNKPNLDEMLTDTDVFIKKDNVPPDFAERLKLVVAANHEKIIVCNTIGYDRWGNPMKPGIQSIVKEFLSEIK